MQIHIKKFKYVEFEHSINKLYVINNIDNEPLNEYSEFPIASITKLFTNISLLLLFQNNKLTIIIEFQSILQIII